MAGAVCASEALIEGKLAPFNRTAGMSLAPFNAWVVHKGLETLAVRMQAQSANALQVAQWLERHPAVERVVYPGLPSHPQHALAMAQQGGCGGAVIAFSVPGATPEQARQRAFHVIDSTRVCSLATNLGDVKTIICHPASTSHGRLTEEQRQAAGVTQGLIRLAVGLEHTGDIEADLARGLNSLA
jgi:O-succinylhomoserine sulfhydrylase